jgi:hypothetical protein
MFRIIGHQVGLFRHLIAQKRVKYPFIDLANGERANVTAALDERDNGTLRFHAAALAIGCLAADESLVNLDNLILAAERTGILSGAHGFADAMAHEPCGLIADV